jgi:predicted lipid-binding transport protein (Tim44 family)
MKRLLWLMLTVFVALSLSVSETEARRLGGGASLGRQLTVSPRTYTAPRTAPPNSAPSSAAMAPQVAARPSGASRWLGPLAGLAAGGLLGALFFGGAFHGLQFMDFLLFGGLIIGGWMLFRFLRRRAEPSYSAPPSQVYENRDRAASDAFSPTTTGVRGESPDWFDPAAFAELAKIHFVRLQAAWDKGDFRDIRDYTSPQLFAELQKEYDHLGRKDQYTEVLTLNAEVIESRREDHQVLVSVLFSGRIREDRNAEAEQVNEIWHVSHGWSHSEGRWLIVGIQQTDI